MVPDQNQRAEEKKGDAAALDELMSERRNVLDHVKGLQDQREQLQRMMETL